MKYLNHIQHEGFALIGKIKEVPTVFKLFLIGFLFFLLLPLTSSAAVV